MNIVILNDFGFVSGGAASVAISSAKGLAARGHRVIFFTAVGPIDPSLSASGVEVIDTGQHDIRAKTTGLSAQLQMIWNSIAARTLLRRLLDLDYRRTIIHLHGWTKALSPSVAQVAATRRFKLVCTLHDYAVACPRGSFFDRGRMDHCRLTPLSWACVTCNCDSGNHLSKLLRTMRQAAQNKLGKIPSGIDAFVLVSRFSRAILEPYLPEHSLICEIPSPIEMERGKPADVAGNRPFLMVGRLTIEKGTILFARAARECGAPVVFGGDGPCRSAIATVNPFATITGWLSRAQVQEQLRHARALVFPSLWHETQGLVVPEAAAVGVPAVVSDTSAAAEGIRDGVTGLLFKNGDLSSLMEALRRLSDDTVVRQLGTACYDAYWKDPPTLERHAERLEELYESVLSRHIR
jgi:glycosyltransferase involved in cell wall biosynthesis